MAHLAADLAVTLEDDRPGTLAKAIGSIAAAGINIDGYSEMNGVVHVLATDLPRTRQCLRQAGFRGIGDAPAANPTAASTDSTLDLAIEVVQKEPVAQL